MTTTAEILQKARDLISDEKNWTQGAMARDAVGWSFTDARDQDAVCFCAVGALKRVTSMREYRDALDVLREELSGEQVVTFNDSHAHSEVLQLFDRAIKRAISAEEAA